MPSRGRMAKWFWALTPVALRAPSVSAQNHKEPGKRRIRPARKEKTSKSLD